MNLRLDGLRLQLLGLVILPFSLVLLGVALAGVRIHQTAMRTMVAERDLRSARATAASLTEQILHRQQSVLGMSQRLQDGISAETVMSEAGPLAQDFDLGLAIIDAQGHVLATNVDPQLWRSRLAPEPLASLAADDTHIAAAFDEGGSPGVLVAARSPDQRTAVAAFRAAGLLMAAFPAPLGAAPVPSIFLIDGQGALLASQGAPPPQPLTSHAGVVEALHGSTGSTFFLDNGVEHVVSYTPVPPLGWALVLEEPWRSATSPLLDYSFAAPLVLIPALLITLLALWFGARRVVQPLRELQSQASALNLEAPTPPLRPVRGIAEIQDLQRTLSLMAMRISSTQQALHSYIGAINRAQEGERGRLARELHDETIQELIALDQRIQLAAIDLHAQASPLADRLDDLHRSATQAIQGVRAMTRGLRPIFLEDLGLLPAIELLIQEARNSLGFTPHLDVSGPRCRLDPDVELAVYRIVQEALTNIGRHANARNGWVEVRFAAGELTCRVRDDGNGFSPPQSPGDLARDGHYGLLGMHERAEMMHAHLSILSAPGQGTTIELRVPPAGGSGVVVDAPQGAAGDRHNAYSPESREALRDDTRDR